MADIVSEMCTFSTNATFCHNCTSLQLTKPAQFKSQAHNMNILPERVQYCKWKMIFLQKRKYLFLFFGKKGIISKSNEQRPADIKKALACLHVKRFLYGRCDRATARNEETEGFWVFDLRGDPTKLGRVLRSPSVASEVNCSGRSPDAWKWRL